MLKKILKSFFFTSYIFIELFYALLIGLITFIFIYSNLDEPNVTDLKISDRVKVKENHYKIGPNWIKKNKYGFWEMYVEGDEYERGVIYGKLAIDLVQKQEEIFVNQINTFVPSKAWQQVLRLMLGFFNKELIYNIPEENLKEIYGVSKSFSSRFDYIGTKYQRILNYHAAHDIGHALNDYNMVGCTSFGLKGEKSNDGQLLVGRNFDFFVGDDFAKEKLLLFLKPKKGIPFASYSWAGFTGVASGLNLKGLSVTINASKSDLPTSSKTPISIVAREILQYAENIEQAIAIAKKRKVFVSETIMVSSDKDNKVVLIEKSPNKMGVYYSKSNEVICSNHFQSKKFLKDKSNVENIIGSDSKYRYLKVKELLNKKSKLTEEDVASILRNQHGLNNDTLGMGNPVALNQLIAHHSVIFKPSKKVMYVSSNDYQLGKYIGYDLNSVFNKNSQIKYFEIKEDEFVNSKKYAQFKYFKQIKNKIIKFLYQGKKLKLSDFEINRFIESNTESYQVYEYLGDYFFEKGNRINALTFYKKSLEKKLPSKNVLKVMKDKIRLCKIKD